MSALRDVYEGSFTTDPEACIARGPTAFGRYSFCALMQKWGNCLVAGCYVRPDGDACPVDNSPEAMARRVEAMERQERKETEGEREDDRDREAPRHSL